MLAGSAELVFHLVAGIGLVLLRQEFHGEMHAAQRTARHRQITRLLGAAGQHHCVKVLQELLGGQGFFAPVRHLAVFGQAANQHTGAQRHAFGTQLLGAPVNVQFVELEVGNAVAQQAANAVVLFKQRDAVADPCQLLRGGHAGGA